MFCSSDVHVGCAQLTFARRGARTVLAHSHVVAPLAIVRPFALPDGGLIVQLITLGPGLCGGDRLTVEIDAGPGTRVVVTTTAASRVLSMDAGLHAEQHVRLRAAENASLEYYPAITIPFPRSAFRQIVQVDAASSARVGLLDAWAMGRSARNEYLQFTRLQSATTLDVDGTLVHTEATDFEPASSTLAAAGILERQRYVASGVWHGVTLDPMPEENVTADLGATVILAQSRPGIAFLRALAANAPALDNALTRSVERVSGCWGLAAVGLGRFRC